MRRAIFGPRLAGAGGFINISQNAKTVVFVGSFMAGDTDVRLQEGRLQIYREGSTRKFVQAVEHRTFSGREACKRGQRVLYVTERCVFQLKADGEQGSLERDLLAHMDFMPAISPNLRLMDAALFLDEPIGLRDHLLDLPLAQRFELDRAHGRLFINFEGLAVDRAEDIDDIEQHLTALLAPLSERVSVVVNYDSCSILPPLLDEYAAMVKRLTERYYSRVTRYGTGGFLKARLEALKPPTA